jgi:hypothetical protein
MATDCIVTTTYACPSIAGLFVMPVNFNNRFPIIPLHRGFKQRVQTQKPKKVAKSWRPNQELTTW